MQLPLKLFSEDELSLTCAHNHEPTLNEASCFEMKVLLKRKAMTQLLTQHKILYQNPFVRILM